MTDKNCDCCNFFSEDYDHTEDDYDIERLEDIIEICEFLIKTKKHRIEKRETMKKLFEDSDKKEEDNSYTRTITNKKVHPYYVYKYTYPWDHPIYKHHRIPWWSQTWF